MEHLSEALVTPEARQKKEVQEEAPKNEKFEDKFNQLRQHRRSGGFPSSRIALTEGLTKISFSSDM